MINLLKITISIHKRSTTLLLHAEQFKEKTATINSIIILGIIRIPLKSRSSKFVMPVIKFQRTLVSSTMLIWGKKNAEFTHFGE